MAFHAKVLHENGNCLAEVAKRISLLIPLGYLTEPTPAIALHFLFPARKRSEPIELLTCDNDNRDFHKLLKDTSERIGFRIYKRN